MFYAACIFLCCTSVNAKLFKHCRKHQMPFVDFLCYIPAFIKKRYAACIWINGNIAVFPQILHSPAD